MGQPLRSPLGHPVYLPPLHRPLLPRLFSLLHGHPLTAWHYNYVLPFAVLLVVALAFLSRRKNPLYRTLTSPTALITYGCIMLAWLIIRNLYGV